MVIKRLCDLFSSGTLPKLDLFSHSLILKRLCMLLFCLSLIIRGLSRKTICCLQLGLNAAARLSTISLADGIVLYLSLSVFTG